MEKKIIFTDQKNKQMGKNSNTIIKTKESNTLILIEFLNHKSYDSSKFLSWSKFSSNINS